MAQPGWITAWFGTSGPPGKLWDSYLDEVNERGSPEPRGGLTSQVRSLRPKLDSGPAKCGFGGSSSWTQVGARVPSCWLVNPASFDSTIRPRPRSTRLSSGSASSTSRGPTSPDPNSGRTGARPAQQGDGDVDFAIEELRLQPAAYRVSTAIVDRGHTYDYADREWDLHVRATGEQEPGLTRMPGLWLGPMPELPAAKVDRS